MTPLLGFAPDMDPTTPGVIVECDNVIPYDAGIKSAPSLINVGLPALPSECYGAAVTRNLAGNTRLFAGTSSNIYEATGMTWTSVASGFTIGVDSRWRFSIFGNASLAVSPSVGMLRSTAGAFAAVPGAPKAKAIVAACGFVLLFGTNEATYNDSPDRWWCSAYLNDADWAPNVSTQCTTGRLVGGSGPITAAMRFGDDVVAYKERAVFFGQYAGAPEVWSWKQVGFDVGCVGVDAVADTSVGHIFVGSDNIYVFDGTRPIPIADGTVRQWWMNNSSSQFRYRTRLLWNRDDNTVMIFYPSVNSSGQCDACLVYHVVTKQWGLMSVRNEAIISYSSSGMTYDGGHPLLTTYDTPINISYDSPFWLASKTSPGVIDTDHTIKTFTGIPGESYIITGDFGSDEGYTMCTALRARYASQPSAQVCTPLKRQISGGTLKQSGPTGLVDGKFGVRQVARFHSFKLVMSGSFKLTGLQPTLVAAGLR